VHGIRVTAEQSGSLVQQGTDLSRTSIDRGLAGCGLYGRHLGRLAYSRICMIWLLQPELPEEIEKIFMTQLRFLSKQRLAYFLSTELTPEAVICIE